MGLIPTIGLEIHIELNTLSKMFCGCFNDSKETEPNKNICPVCSAQPGTLPAANAEAVKKTIKTALALNCQIASSSFFERKNYFYPDLPKGYQISQYQAPLSKNGYLDLPICSKRIRIERIHLEEDTGSLAHPEGVDYSLVNLNRAGVPLMELVTKPDIHTAQEAVEFVKELQMILRYLGVSGANMEKGEMRAEVNISLAKEGEILGNKVEIKNLNSIKVVEKSIEYEIKRQGEILEKGEKIIQETRGFNEQKQATFSQREKESAHDYRYFPEPDLPPIDISPEEIEQIKNSIPELPNQKRARFAKEYGLTTQETELYTSQKELGDYFEQVVSDLNAWVADKYQKGLSEQETQKLFKLASNYIATDLQAILKERDIDDFAAQTFKITPENFAEFLSMIYLGEISSKIAKMVISEMFENGGDPTQIIEDKGWQMISNETEIQKAVEEVLSVNQKAIDDYKNGKASALQFLAGMVMAKTQGKASPQKVQEILKTII